MGRIFYFCPDFSSPSGGTKRLYRHVVQLNRQGLDACIVHQKRGFVLTWHGYKVPILWLEDNLEFTAQDILVFPEGMASLMKQTDHFPCTRIAIALNWAYVYGNLPKTENWKDYGIRQAITPSPLIKDFLEWSMDLDVTLIDNYVDTKRYSYQPHRKRNTIAYMPRKNLAGEIIRSIFEKKEGLRKIYKWIALKDLTEEEYSKQLVEAKIFLAASLEEGVHASVLEAMASGCVVVCFSGVGGNDYMIRDGDKQNCFLAENGNYLELGRTLEQVIIQWENDSHIYDLVIQNAIETAKVFEDFDREGMSLKRYFESFQ